VRSQFCRRRFFLLPTVEIAGILPYFKIETFGIRKKIKAKPGFSLWSTAQRQVLFILSHQNRSNGKATKKDASVF
jgi:hypothetical protein